jgi:endogenous inhibitor of DNA gyrase (YacG/DUF329 family)
MTVRRRSVPCPQCAKAVEWTAGNRYRPFCSERCKLIDLGAWASEAYRAPVVEDANEPGDSEPESGAS